MRFLCFPVSKAWFPYVFHINPQAKPLGSAKPQSSRYDRRVVRGNTYAAVVQPEDSGEAELNENNERKEGRRILFVEDCWF